MPLDIDPTVDYAFKRLFGDPANEDLLLHLLNAVLGRSPPIVDVEILNPFNEKEFAADKLSVLDIKARSAAGVWYNIEIQSRAHWSLRPRLAYYGASLYVDQLKDGEDYTVLSPAITICFLKEALFRETAAAHLRFSLRDANEGVELTDRLQVHTIELTKYNFEGVRLVAAEGLVQWAFFLSRAADLEAAELKRLLPQQEFVKATKVVEMIAQTPEERMQYRARQKAELDYRSFLNDARREGMAIGLEEGREQGRTEGRLEGRQEGRQEGAALGREEGHKLGLIEQVQMLQDLAGDPIAASEQLSTLDSLALSKLIGELKNRVRKSQP